MPKLHTIQHEPGDGHPDLMFWCPGCKCGHGVWIHPQKNGQGATWKFNGNFEKPTFEPSLKVTGPMKDGGPVGVCHTVVTDGVINFCADCTHELAGKSVPMEDF